MMLEALSGLTQWTTYHLEVFFLVFIRVVTLIFMLPFLKLDLVIPTVKVGLGFFLTLIIFSALPEQTIVVPSQFAGFMAIVIQEMMVGILMGFTSMFLFSALEMGGEILDREIGINSVQVLNPHSEEMVTGVAMMNILIFTVMFLVSNGHFFFIRAIQESYTYVPIGLLHFSAGKMIPVYTQLILESFVTGLKICAPVLSITLVSSVAMAFMARVMPQMNIWLVAMPLKIALGMGAVIFTMPMMYQIFQFSFTRVQENIFLILKLSGPANG